MNMYDIMYEAICDKYEHGEITLRDAKILNNTAYEKYVIEAGDSDNKKRDKSVKSNRFMSNKNKILKSSETRSDIENVISKINNTISLDDLEKEAEEAPKKKSIKFKK